MKTILMSIVLLAGTLSFAGPCVVPRHTNKQLFNAVLDFLSDESTVATIAVKRKTAFSASADVTTDKKEQKSFLIKQRCEDGQLVVEEDKNPKDFVCQNSWIDCSPGMKPNPEKQKYCTKEYAVWAEVNCGGQALIAQ